MQVATAGLLLLLLLQTLLCPATQANQVPDMHTFDTPQNQSLLALGSVCIINYHAIMPQGNSSLPLRVWLDEYAFTSGETTLLREEIEVGRACALIQQHLGPCIDYPFANDTCRQQAQTWH